MAGKKRKLPAQSTTLHDFFKTASASATPAKSTLQPKRSLSQSPAIAKQPEIIVIDSDDEENIDPCPRRRRTLSDSKSAAVESPAPRKQSFGAPCLLVDHKPKPEPGEHRLPLGAPCLLVERPKTADVASAGDAPVASSSSVLITSPPAAHPQLVDLSSAFDDTAVEDNENVWALEDDELLTFGPDDEDVDVDMDLDAVVLGEDQDAQRMPSGDCTPGPSKADPEESCPLCALSFLDLSQDDVQDHVNACLDKLQPRASASSKPPRDRPMRPISHLPVPPAPKTAARRSNNAFSVLMSGHKENEAWKEATEAEDSAFKGGRRKAPFYKVMQGMPIAVDAFRYGKIPGVAAYFLTHAHSDHYTNLSSSWKHGPIYCSETTGNLIVHLLGVDRKWVHPLAMDVPTVIPNTGGVEVTVIEANHCPGSSLFLFSGKQTADAGDSTFRSPGVGTSKIYRYLHCGDFRASPQHVLHPAIKAKKLDLVYLDTTYLNAKYCFPPQPQVIAACADLAKQIVDNAAKDAHGGAVVTGAMDAWCKPGPSKGKEKETDAVAKADSAKSKLLVVVGTYSIGKERIVKAIAKTLNAKVFCDARKRAILQCQADPELHAMLSSNPKTALVHVVPLQHISVEHMEEYLEKMGGAFGRILAFRPTGWTYTPPSGTDLAPAIGTLLARDHTRRFTAASLKPGRGSSARIMLYGVPYSEHSSFSELTAFALSCDWGKMIATVNVGSATSRGKMHKWFEKWNAERRARAARGEHGVVPYRAPDYW